MLWFVAVHDDATFRFQLPGSLVDVQHNYVHTQVKRSFLSAEAGAEAGVKEDHQQGFITSQFYIFKPVFLDLE